MTGYYLGDENETEEINFTLSRPVKKIRIFGGALSAPNYAIEFFTLRINGKHHKVQPSELITPDPSYGRKCILQPNGSIMGDTIPAGYGSFILTYEHPNGITSFQLKDSITRLPPNGAIFDLQIYTTCDSDTSTVSDKLKVFIPNVLTPNADGKNDFFRAVISGNLEQFKLLIFNRWGQNIFSSTDRNEGWDGTISGRNQETGVFFWVCYYQGVGQNLQISKGTVSLIR